MQFIKETDLRKAIQALTTRLTQELQENNRVLWLISCDSNIHINTAVMQALPADLLPRLAIILTDERFGPLDAPSSNLAQLLQSGFQPGTATLIPVLTSQTNTLASAVQRYEAALKIALQNAQSIVATLNMGSDGRIAGILPESPAASSRTLVASFQDPDYERITITPRTLRHATCTFVFAYGAEKQAALLQLRDKTLPIHTQPAQLLRKNKNVIVYNDQVR
jgi:6-phosphogluconolactonase/glucosamine-6-phosphate isomerase/deaminase